MAQPVLQPALTGESPISDSTRLPASLIQSLAWGLGRSIALEHPGLWGGLIDLPLGLQPAAQADLLLDEFFEPDGEDQVAYREGKRYVARLTLGIETGGPVQLIQIQPEATYLITGGLGNIGLALAGWLAGQGAKHIVLTSRTGLPDREMWGEMSPDSMPGRRIQAVQSIESATGAVLEVVCADVADLSQMTVLLSRLRRDYPPIKGLFHAAGMTVYQPLVEIDGDTLAQVLRPKVAGTWVLCELAKDLPLDFFVLFSSGASIWGSQGLAHYAAANHYLDAVAHNRAAAGLPALSINWGWWAGDGMVTQEMATLFRQVGLQEMSTAQAIQILSHLLSSRAIQQIVVAIDWNTFKPLYEATGPRSLLANILVDEQAPGVRVEAGHDEFIKQLSEAAPSRRKELLLQHLHNQVASVLGFQPSDPIDIRQGFFKLGMDSMMTMQLRTRLEASLNYSLPPTLAFEYTTISTMADYLFREILPKVMPTSGDLAVPGTSGGMVDGKKRGVETPAEKPDSGSQDDLAEVSDQELLDLLDSELSRIDDLLEGE